MTMEMINPCKLCCQNESKYMCPRCNIPYCSLPCYQSEAHIQCSETFYKDCVVEQIKNDELDKSSQKSMIEILKRYQKIDEQVEDDVPDSDDESDNEQELADRLDGVDLDDADTVWQQLTAQEKQDFQDLLRSGDVSEVIPLWEPWWLYREKKKLVEDLASGSQPAVESEPALACPPVRTDIQPFSKLSKVTAAPCVRWNVVNVLAAYAVTTRVYNGDHLNTARDAATMLIALCDNLASNQLFESPELAVTAVHLAAVNGDCVVGGVAESQLSEDVQRLVQGPSDTSQNLYVLAALSDIHSLFTSARQKAKDKGNSKGQGEFSKRFPNSSSSSVSRTSTSDLNKYLKKIEFYLSWTVEYF